MKRVAWGVRIPAGLSFCLFLCAATFLQAQPNISAAVNSASYMDPGLPNGGIAQGAMFVVFGDNLGPVDLVKAQSLPLPTALAGTSLRVTANGKNYPVPLVYSSKTLVAGIFPSTVPVGEAFLIASFNNAESSAFRTRVRKSAFGIYTQNSAGLGTAVVQNWAQGLALNGLFRVILNGQVGILWGTGLGAIDGSDADVPPAGDLPGQVEVLIGGQSAKVLYHGRSPSYPGLDQVNFEVPQGIVGCYVPIAVRTDGVMSNFASISIGSSGTVCGDDVAWRGALFTGVGNDLRVGIVEMRREEYSYPAGAPVFWSEQGTARFFDVLRSDLNFLPRLADLQVLPGTCNVYWNRWSTEDERANFYPNLTNLPTPPVLGMSSLKINGPAGTKFLDAGPPGEFEAHLGGMDEPGGPAAARFVVTGAYTFDNKPAQPAAIITAATATDELGIPLTLPSEVFWSNKAQLTSVDRSQDLTFTWTGGLDGQGYVVVGGSSADESLRTRVTFMCAQKPSAGMLTVPASILSVLPVNSASPPNAFPNGLLFVGITSSNGNSLDSRVVRGTLNMLYFRYLLMSYSIVDFH